MMSKVSAIGAIVFGLLFAGLAAAQIYWDLNLQVFAPALTAAALLVGGYRTLRKMSGGLRLLAGAWGVAAGLTLQPVMYRGPEAARTYDAWLGSLTALIWAAPFLCLIGLALIVLHKESKS